MATLRVTILGCGSSGGVPRSTGDWGTCDPDEPKNRRMRCGLLLQQWPGEAGAASDATTVLVDTPPDLRFQLQAAKPAHIDAILFSHDHADQTHGIDDVRAFFLKRRARIPAYLDAETRKSMMARFGYIFEGVGGYPAILHDSGTIEALKPIAIRGPGGKLELTPLQQDHGDIISYGFRAGPFAYNNDVVALPEASLGALGGLKLWIVDALRDAPHPSHAHVGQALDWIERLKPAHAVLTNLNHDLDYATLKARLPDTIEPAYDGWTADLAI